MSCLQGTVTSTTGANKKIQVRWSNLLFQILNGLQTGFYVTVWLNKMSVETEALKWPTLRLRSLQNDIWTRLQGSHSI